MFMIFVQSIPKEFFGGNKTGGKKTNPSFKGYIIEGMDFYRDYKDLLADNFYSFIELIVVKRKMNDNTNV